MSTQSDTTFIEHQFKLGETINAAIRFHNHPKLTDDEMDELQRRYNELNDNKVPRPFQVVKIPILGDIC